MLCYAILWIKYVYIKSHVVPYKPIHQAMWAINMPQLEGLARNIFNFKFKTDYISCNSLSWILIINYDIPGTVL